MIANAARTRDAQTELLARLQRSSWQKHSSPSPGRDSCIHTSDNCMLTRKFREQVRITATSPETTVSNHATNTQVHVYPSWYVINQCLRSPFLGRCTHLAQGPSHIFCSMAGWRSASLSL